MSRIGKKPVPVPAGVDVKVDGATLRVKGPKGNLDCKVAPGISFDFGDGAITVTRPSESPRHRAYHGLMRSLLNNMVVGVTQGFDKKLEIVGVGYKAEVKGKSVTFHLGYSHPIDYPFPDGIDIKVANGNQITVHGHDKALVGQVAANLRSFRPPDSYKGKGVRYVGEVIRLKAGKTGQ